MEGLLLSTSLVGPGHAEPLTPEIRVELPIFIVTLGLRINLHVLCSTKLGGRHIRYNEDMGKLKLYWVPMKGETNSVIKYMIDNAYGKVAIHRWLRMEN